MERLCRGCDLRDVDVSRVSLSQSYHFILMYSEYVACCSYIRFRGYFQVNIHSLRRLSILMLKVSLTIMRHGNMG